MKEYTCFSSDLSTPPVFSHMDLKNLCFLDIETTGLTPETASLSVIGLMRYTPDGWQVVQFFADDYQSEDKMLYAFAKAVEDCPMLIHFNGSTFDIPFLTKKAEQYNLPPLFPHEQIMLDLYRVLGACKSILPLPNLKQKTLEQYMGTAREDSLSGKELIGLYSSYLQQKICKGTEDQHILQLILLHNREDLMNMLQLCNLLVFPLLFASPRQRKKFPDFLQNNTGIKSVDQVMVSSDVFALDFTLNYPCIVNYSYNEGPFSIHLSKEKGNLRCKISHDTLYYFYPDYKNYYYLPAEDTAIYKSVATYVDKAYRKKASPENCYTKRTGRFIPSFSFDSHPVLYKGYKSKPGYVEITKELEEDKDSLKEYVQDICSHIKSWSQCNED